MEAASAATSLLDQTAQGATALHQGAAALHLGLGRRAMNRFAYHARRVGLAPVVGAAGGDEGSAIDAEYASAFGATPVALAPLSPVEEPGSFPSGSLHTDGGWTQTHERRWGDRAVCTLKRKTRTSMPSSYSRLYI